MSELPTSSSNTNPERDDQRIEFMNKRFSLLDLFLFIMTFPAFIMTIGTIYFWINPHPIAPPPFGIGFVGITITAVYSFSRLYYLFRLKKLPECKAAEKIGDTLIIYGYDPKKGHNILHKININDISSFNPGAFLVSNDGIANPTPARGYFLGFEGWHSAYNRKLVIHMKDKSVIAVMGFPRAAAVKPKNLINYPFAQLRKAIKIKNKRGIELNF